MAIQNPKRLISVDEYHQMGDDGLFAHDERVELIEGEIVEMSPIKNLHATGVRRLDGIFQQALHGRVVVDAQNPVRLGDWSEPQPDIKLLAWRADYYAETAPVAEDVLLLVEVADTSARYDRKTKAPLYGRHGIREYWLLDLGANVLEVYRRPGPDGYADVRRLRRGDSIAPEALQDVVFAVSELLGLVDRVD